MTINTLSSHIIQSCAAEICKLDIWLALHSDNLNYLVALHASENVEIWDLTYVEHILIYCNLHWYDSFSCYNPQYLQVEHHQKILHHGIVPGSTPTPPPIEYQQLQIQYIFSRVLPILTWIAKFVVRVFALTFREGFLSARALTKYKLYCTIHKILDGFDINKEEIGYEWWKVLQNDVFVWCISIYTFNYIFLVN